MGERGIGRGAREEKVPGKINVATPCARLFFLVFPYFCVSYCCDTTAAENDLILLKQQRYACMSHTSRNVRFDVQPRVPEIPGTRVEHHHVVCAVFYIIHAVIFYDPRWS